MASGDTTITFSNLTIDENSPQGTVIGTITYDDPDGGDTIYVDGTINGVHASQYLELVNNFDGTATLIVGATPLDYETLVSQELQIYFQDYEGNDEYIPFTLIVNDVNEGGSTAPVATDDTASTVKDLSKAISVLSNDTDADGTLDLASITIVDAPQHGTVTINTTTGVITYKPTSGYVGTDTFTYTVKDDAGNVSNVATVTLDVTGAHILTSGDDVFSGDSLGLTANGIEVHGGDGADYIVTSNQAAKADTIYGGDGNDVIFTGGGDDYVEGGAGDDVIHARAGNDTVIGGDGNDTYVVRFTDTGTTTITDNDGALFHGTFRPASYLSSWTPAPGATSGFAIAGEATIVSEGVWSLTLTDNTNATRTLTLTLNGSDLTITESGKPQTVVIKDYVNGTFGLTLEVEVDGTPVATDDTVSTVKDLTKTINVLANDTDADGTLDVTSVTIVDSPLHGTVTVNATSGVITYKPTSGYMGSDTFTYTIKDNEGNVSNVATVTLDVTGAHILTSGDDVFSGDSLGLTANGIEVHGGDGADYIVTSNQAAKADTIYGGAGNDVIFTGGGDDYVEGGDGNDVIHARAGNDTVIGGAGDDTFVVRFTDVGTTTITDNDGTLFHGTFRPASYPTSWTPAPGATSGFAIAGTATEVSEGVWSLVLTDNTNATRTLTLSWSGADLTITESGKPQTVVIKDYVNGTFGITLAGVLFAGDDTVSTVKDLTKTINVLANDTDDSALDPTSVTIVDSPLHGTVTVNATTGVITYKPTSGYVGADTFTYTVKDDAGNVSNVATVTLDVAGAHILTSGDDVFSGDSLGLTANGIEVHGGDGSDYIVTSNQAAKADTIYGGAGNDVIFTGGGDDYVEGGAGDDVIHARAGNDTVIGGDGNDTYVVRFTDSGTTTITDNDGALFHGTFRPASYPSSWTPAPGATSGFAIAGEATIVSEGVWSLTLTDNTNATRTLTLTLNGSDLTITESGKPQTVVIKDYVNGTFGITLAAENHAPTNLALSNDDVDENSAVGTVVGTLSATDPEGGAVIYSLSAPSDYFEIVGNEIRVKGSLDYEAIASHNLTVIASDADGKTTQQTFEIDVNDVDEAPTEPSKGMITIDVSGQGSAGVDFEAYIRGGFISDTVGGGFPSFDNSGAFSGEEMFIGYGDTAASKYVLAHGNLTYSFDTHTIVGEINTIEFGTRGTGSFDANGYYTGGNTALKITGLTFANGTPTNPTEEASIEANGLVHLFGIAHMYGNSSDPATAAKVAAALDKIADGLDAYAQHFIGSAGADVYVGTQYADEIEGGAGNDMLSGGGGDDIITGGAGNDIIAGGFGSDTAAYGELKSNYTITDNGDGTFTVLDGAAGTSDTLSGVEFLRFKDKIVDLSDGSETPVGEPPENIQLSATSVAENATVGTVIGMLSAVDPDGGAVSFALTGAVSDKFEIVGNELRLKAGVDFETAYSHDITVRVTDAFGSTTDKTFTINVTDIDETPVNLALSKTSVAESAAVGTVIGTLSATDPEGGVLTYSLGSNPDGKFEIVGTELRLKAGLDYETVKNHPITILVKDAAGNMTSKDFTIKVTNVDEAPVLVALSNASIAENSAIGTVIGTLSAVDPEGGDVVYSLSSNPGGMFAIVDNKLQVAKALNFEATASYTIKVEAIDVGGNVTEKTFTIGVTDVNEAPGSVALSKATIAENSAVGTTIGTLSAVDPEGQALTYKLTDNAGGLFKLNGNVLQLAKAVDYETLKSDTITVEVTDVGGLTVTKTFTIGITDVNEAPGSVALSKATVAENSAVGTTIGTLSAVDPEGKALTYTLTDNAGGLFKLNGNVLQLAKGVDYETLKSDTITVEVSDGVTKTTKTFTIGIIDVNEAPGSVALSKSTVAENSAVGATIGTLSAVDPEGKALTYKLTDNAGGLFKLDGNKLQVAKAIDYERVKSDTITVEVSDGVTKTTKTFTIGVTDVNEAPGSVALSKATVAENSAIGTAIGTLSAVDPEGKALTYRLTDNAGGLFKLNGNVLQLAKAVNYETLKSDTITVEVKDAGGLTVTKTFTIGVTDVNEAPGSVALSKATVAENTKVGTVIGTLSAVDPEGKALTYKLLDNAGGLFKLDGNKLQVAKGIDYESVQSDTIKVEVKDAGGLTVTKTFTIGVTDVLETITGTSASQTLKGGIGADKIVAGAGNDTLIGYAGSDLLYGDAGNDTVYGGLGADDLTGGAGKDTFLFKTLGDSTVSSTGRDTIFDFSVTDGDMIDLKAIDANTKIAGDQAFSFIGAAEFGGKAGELRFYKTSANTYVYGDVDGDAKADFAIHLDDAVTLTKGYFVL